MVFQNNVLSGAGGSGTAVHTIDQSIRFNGVDTPQLTRTPSSSGNLDKWTFSCWVKRGKLGQSGGGGSHQLLLSAGNDVNNFTFFGFRDSGSLPSGGVAESLNLVASVSGSTIFELSTTQVFRDPSAWYNIVGVYDSGNSVSSERCRVYINGSRITEFNVETYPSQNQDSDVNESGVVQRVGALNLGTNKGHLDGYLAEIVLIDGQALDPSSFGEYNSSGIWIPKDVSDLTFGTNGFHIDGRDSADLGDDESGNGNDFTTSGLASHDQVPDSPTNNFCVMNPLDKTSTFSTSEGNLKTSLGSAGSTHGIKGTIGVSTGKWYWEGRRNLANVYHCQVGATSTEVSPNKLPPINTPDNGGSTVGYWGTSLYKDGVAVQTGLAASTNGDIIGLALDLDSTPNTVTFTKNGSALGTAVSVTSGFTWMPCEGSDTSGYTPTISTSHNFGQDGTMAGLITAGGNSDGNGVGNFKYSVPSGYLALCTKNLGS